jgi:hypothetical protein
LRGELAARGFQSTRLLWMQFEGLRPERAEIPVVEVPYDAVDDLRIAWHAEDFPGQDASEFHAQAREIRLALGTRVLAVYEDSHPVAFAALDVGDDETEIAVCLARIPRSGPRHSADPGSDRRRRGRRALWICADDEGRPKQLYCRLGFRPALATMEFLRVS